MTSFSHVRVLVNPCAGAGRAARQLPRVCSALTGLDLRFDIVKTKASGDATHLTRQAREDGVSMLLVVGGDGTLNEVAQAYVDSRGQRLGGPELALVPAGTGGDYCHTLGLSSSIEEAVGRLRYGSAKTVDLGILEIVNPDTKRKIIKAFFNVTSFGIGGLVDQLVQQSPMWFGGKACFFVASLRALLRYRNLPVRIRIDGQIFYEGPILNAAVCQGQYFGGGMRIAPHADPTDGLFDIVVLGGLTKREALALTHTLYRGAHLQQPNIFFTHGRTLEAEPLDPNTPVLIDMDGETPGQLPLTATVLPGAVRVWQ